MSITNTRSRALEFLTFSSQVVWTIILIFASYILKRPLHGHALSIAHVSLKSLTLHDVRYSGALYDRTYTYTFTARDISIDFHLPRPIYPRWLTITAHSLFYTSSTSDISVETLDITCWLFPYLFKRTAGPWCSVVLDGFRVRVFGSSATPYWITRLRQSLVSSLLEGDIYRLDNFGTKVQFAGLSEPFIPAKMKQRRRRADSPVTAEHPVREREHVAGGNSFVPHDLTEEDDTTLDEGEDDTSDDTSQFDSYEGGGSEMPDGQARTDHPPPFANTATDELRISAFARQLHFHNTHGRVYTFGRADAQLRRDWDTDRGSFVMVAEESRWVRVHWPYQRETNPSWLQLLTSIGQFPLDLYQVLDHPMRAVNIHVSRADITFDEFRIRDAELIVQALMILRQKTAHLNINWGDVLLDGFIQAFVRS
ncbi:hypothetical protein WOLCODRAFT_148231 [Wolfiporia cocos MD-104 SS10]|uniref:Uncharacterized protein n=1 Tax=Wolfiporia cocos (strain MD-104) TaxID=742152 RepID=A0A2H3IW29_WOLCO|nr:hypothetical protein WOLCODRAFT_148231 [Wolfiporia cocos MD-104 SS10]